MVLVTFVDGHTGEQRPTLPSPPAVQRQLKVPCRRCGELRRRSEGAGEIEEPFVVWWDRDVKGLEKLRSLLRDW